MKESFSSGESLARSSQETLSVLPLINPRVQVSLAQLAFPGDAHPLVKWVDADSAEDSLASRFRAYIEDPVRTPTEQTIDIQNTESLRELLRAVQEHAPEPTLH